MSYILIQQPRSLMNSHFFSLPPCILLWTYKSSQVTTLTLCPEISSETSSSLDTFSTFHIIMCNIVAKLLNLVKGSSSFSFQEYFLSFPSILRRQPLKGHYKPFLGLSKYCLISQSQSYYHHFSFCLWHTTPGPNMCTNELAQHNKPILNERDQNGNI